MKIVFPLFILVAQLSCYVVLCGSNSPSLRKAVAPTNQTIHNASTKSTTATKPVATPPVKRVAPPEIARLNESDTESMLFISRLINAKTSTIIPKSQFSNKKRLLFVAGLEGTGHHAFKAMFEICVTNKTCVAASGLSKTLMSFDSKYNILRGLFSAGESWKSPESLQKAFIQMKAIASSNDNVIHIVGKSMIEKTCRQHNI